MARKRLAIRRRVSQAKASDHFIRKSSVREIGARQTAFRRSAKLRSKEFCGSLMHLVKNGSLSRLRVVGLVPDRLPQGDSHLFRDPPQGFWKCQALQQHHELEDIAAHAAAETVENLLSGMNRKGGRLLMVKRTEPYQVYARLAQPDMLPYDTNAVRRRPNFIHLAHGGSLLPKYNSFPRSHALPDQLTCAGIRPGRRTRRAPRCSPRDRVDRAPRRLFGQQEGKS